MPNEICGEATPATGKYAVVVSRYNESITRKLLEGAVETLLAAGVPDASIDVVWVPGAWELPVVASTLVGVSERAVPQSDYRAILCLGAVIRGETTHDQHINQQVSASLGSLAVKTGIPVLFGVLTCNSLEQAIARSGGAVGNKGVECAQAALEMADLMAKLPARP